MANKHDPISQAFFAPLEAAEAAVTAIYFANAAISLAIWLAEWLAAPTAIYFLKVVLLGSSIVGLILAAGVRLYYWPGAHDKRLADSLSAAFAVDLTEERTTGYFNNDESDPICKLGMQSLENMYFCKRQADLLWHRELKISGSIAAAWFIASFSGVVTFDVVMIVGLVFFGEQVLFRFVRVHWLMTRVEKIFEDLLKVIQGVESKPIFVASVIEHHTRYENAKTLAAITFSEKEFHANNGKWSREWDDFRKRVRRDWTSASRP